MSFFNDDPFENMVRDIFGGRPRAEQRQSQIIQGEEEDRIIDFIESDGYVYLVFEMAGFNEEDVTVKVKSKELIIDAMKGKEAAIQNYLKTKLNRGVSIKKQLPSFVNPKKFTHTVRNGVLEVKFTKK